MRGRVYLCLAACAAVLVPAAAARAQIELLSENRLGDSLRSAGGPVSVVGALSPAGPGRARLLITARLQPGLHIYSTTQKPGGPVPTKIVLDPSPRYRLMGTFAPLKAPEITTEPLFGNLTVETHEGEVTWQALLELMPGVQPAQVEVRGSVSLQACTDRNCLPPESYPFVARLGSARAQIAANPPRRTMRDRFPTETGGAYLASQGHLTIRGKLVPRVAAPGGTATISLTAEPAPGWHVYALAARDPEEISKPTLIALEDTPGLRAGNLRVSRTPTQKPGETPYYEGPVTWTLDVLVPPSASPGQYTLSGIIGFQTCREFGCDAPSAARFSTMLVVGQAGSTQAAPLEFTRAKYGEAAHLAATRPLEHIAASADPASAASTAATAPASSLWLIILSGLAGGLILNLMPCVLPVIGLKILSFVEQGGHHRAQVMALNLWYSAGLMLVFMILATLAVWLNLGWGQQFTSTSFNIVLSAIVFVMALSFLGVWEIPLPGFVGSGAAVKAASREGAMGAFSKGVLTTILATPCSGPFLGPVFGFTLKQPPYVTYLLFTCIGLGMASPYLLIGAYPRLIRFLPKPGAWMDTFKQMMGFVLLGTVVFLFTFLDRDYLVATFGLLVGLWAACWWIGRIPVTLGRTRKLWAWAEGAAFATAAGFVCFALLVPRDPVLAWQPFSRPTLTHLTSQGKTVLVDFTAEWCLTCKLNLKFAIDTEEVRQLVEQNGVVPLLADWTNGSPEIKEMLASLGSNSIPVLAIFPADRPDKPIILRDLISKQHVLDKLKEAGPSRPSAAQTAASDEAARADLIAAER